MTRKHIVATAMALTGILAVSAFGFIAWDTKASFSEAFVIVLVGTGYSWCRFWASIGARVTKWMHT